VSLLAAVIEVDGPQTMPAWLGRAAQAWLLNEVRRVDPALATWLHDHQQRRPYTISAPRGENDQRWLRVTSVNSDLTALLLEQLFPTLQIIKLAGIDLAVRRVLTDKHEWAGQSDFESLARRIFDENPERAPGFEFATPTAFHSGGLSVPLPLPGLIYGSLVLAWNTFSPVALPVTMGDFVDQCIGVARHRIASRMVRIGEQEQQVGFTGKVQFVVVPQAKSGFSVDEYRVRLQMLELLTQFAFYVGVGVRTTVGMGQMRPLHADF
jgi:CRISPR-associated endoribonuclease Cas6